MPDVDLAAIRRELADSPLLADFNALVRDWGIRGAKVRTLTSERDGLIRDRDCYRSAWRVLHGRPPLPGFEVSPLDPVPPRVVGVLDETHVWRTAVDVPPLPTGSAAVRPLETT